MWGDSPGRPVLSNEMVFWEAETSLLQKFENGEYKILATVSYGFIIEIGGIDACSKPLKIITNPSKFHLKTINDLTK